MERRSCLARGAPLALRAAKGGSAAGPSGLRPQHLLDGVKSPLGESVVEQLVALVGILARGLAPSAIAPWFAGGALFAGAKSDGGVRPLVAGEALRRLTSRCLCSAVTATVRDVLGPNQIGEATSHGVEVGAHLARDWMRRSRDHLRKVALKLDVRNAHNEVKRGAFLRAFRRRLPALSCWAEWCYGDHSRLLFFAGDNVITSEDGGQQGDNLVGIAWALTLQEILPQVLARGADGDGSLDFAFFFKDDGWACGDDTAVARFYHALRELGPPLGIVLGVPKCEVIPAAGVRSHADLALFAADSNPAAATGVPALSGAANGFSLLSREEGLFDILGAPIGDVTFAAAAIDARVAKAQPLLDAIAAFQGPQVAMPLLHSCASFGELIFAARVVPFGDCNAEFDVFDARVRRCPDPAAPAISSRFSHAWQLS